MDAAAFVDKCRMSRRTVRSATREHFWIFANCFTLPSLGPLIQIPMLATERGNAAIGIVPELPAPPPGKLLDPL